jgi:uncharacterized membrane protein YfcA
LTGLSPAQVAGTAIVTHISTGALGIGAYTRSGRLREARNRRTALILAAAALVGTPLGVFAGTLVSRHVFSVVLGGVVAAAAGLVWYRARSPRSLLARPPGSLIAVLGLALSAVAGIVGIGGPMLTVPLLAVAGLPMLESLACAQAQSVVIATVGTLGYLIHGTIDWPLAALVGRPELAGVLAGWKIAHALPARALRNTLVATLCILAVYLVFQG